MNKYGYYKSRNTGCVFEKDKFGKEHLVCTTYRREICTTDFDNLLRVDEFTFIVDPVEKVITEKLSGCKIQLHKLEEYPHFSLWVAATYSSLKTMDKNKIIDAVNKNAVLVVEAELLATILIL